MNNLKEISDKDLLLLFSQGQQSALNTLILRHKRRVFSYILVSVRDRDLANDLFQDIFIKVVKTVRLGEYNEEGKFIQWVLRIAHNMIIDHFRKAGRSPVIEHSFNDYSVFETIPVYDESAEEKMISSQVLLDVKNLINYLPIDQKQILEMRMYEDMSFKEIADELEISINTALGRMRYALINMRKLIEKHKIVIDC